MPRIAISRAVVCWLGFGRPEALRNVVERIPKRCTWAVIIWAKRASEPPRYSPSAAAASLAERVISAITASSTVMLLPAPMPIFVGGRDAAYLEKVILVFLLIRPA